MRKVFAAFATVTLTAAILTGCGGGKTASSAATAASSAAAAVSEAAASAASEATAAASEATAAVSTAAAAVDSAVEAAATTAVSEAEAAVGAALGASESAVEAVAATAASEVETAVSEAEAAVAAALGTSESAVEAAVESAAEAAVFSAAEAVAAAADTAVSAAAAVESVAGTAESLAEAPAAGGEAGFVFKHGFDLDYPPYSFIDDDGKIGGFDVEMAQAVCNYYGWEYEAVPFNWDAKDAELNAGSCDCIWSGFTMNGREDDYLWSKPYSDNTQMIMVSNDSGIEKLADLAGKAVGVQTSTSAYDLLNDEEGQKALADTFGSLQVYETYTIAFNDLKAGAIDAIAIDVTSGNYLMSGETNYKFLDEQLGSEQYGIGFRKDDTELCEKINAALDALSADGTVDEIGKKYPDIYDYLTLK